MACSVPGRTVDGMGSQHVSAMAGNDGNGEYSDIFGRVKWASGEVEHLK